MGLSSSKTKTTSNQNTTESATTTPTNPAFVGKAIEGMTNQIGALGQASPYSFVAGPSALQTQAFGAAQNLGGWKQGNLQAQALAAAAGGAGPNLAQAAGYQAPQIAQTALGPASQMGAAQAETFGYTPFINGNAAQSQVVNAGVPQLGPVASYEAAQAGAKLAGPAQLAKAQQATASQASQYMNQYMNPYLSEVVDTTLADMDVEAERVRAGQLAAAARNGGLAGSRFGIAQGATEGELARARASTAANLRSNAFNFAGQMGSTDADRATQTSGLNAQLGTQVNTFNAGEQNAAERTNAELGTNVNIANAGFANDERKTNTAARNSFTMTQAEMEARAALQNAQLGTQNNQYNTAQTNQNNWVNQAAINEALARNIGWQNEGQQFNAGLRQQTEAANSGYNNQFALAGYQGQLQQNLAQAGMNAEAAQFGANAFNTNQQFNAQAYEQQLARQLQGAQALGSLSNGFASNSLADIALQGQLGGEQQALMQQYASAPLQQLALQAQLYGSMPYNLFNGQTVNGATQSNGSSTTKSSPSMFNMALSAAQAAAAFSDRRLKRDVSRIDRMENGLGVYRYAYVWDEGPPERIGVTADEVAKLVPEALGPTIGGYATVNYDMLGGM